MRKLDRRDFLKLAALLPGAAALSSFAPRLLSKRLTNKDAPPNIIILLFDAMSATNLSLYGYHRKTTPNFERFAERANVYHSHNAGGNFTSAGTASLLTGMYPWTHRAINLGGMIERDLVDRNIFRFFHGDYTRLAYSQNLWPNYFFNQFTPKIDKLLSPGAFSTVSQIIGSFFNDPAAYRAYEDFLFQDGQPPASLVFGLIGRLLFRRQYFTTPVPAYPDGMPHAGVYPIFFELHKVFDGIVETIDSLPQPFLAYFHLWSPHSPYGPSKEFMNLFNDNWKPVRKPNHPLGTKIAQSALNRHRANYDRYIANIDDEFGKLVKRFDQLGIFDNSYVIVTSDHGELFERGVYEHATPLLNDPVVHIPLMISAPGQRTRMDIHSPTNSVDVLPTLLHLAGRDIPDWCEGAVLPGLGGKDDFERSTFSVEAKGNAAYAPLTKVSVALRKGNYKLTYYTGYDQQDVFELYHQENDPEELEDLSVSQPDIAGPLKDELLAKLNAVNQPFRKS